MKLRLRQYIFLSYILLLFVSGVLHDPVSALVVASLYEAGFVGLMLVYVSSKKDGDMRIGFLALGVTLIAFCFLWLEVVFRIKPL